MKRRHRGAKRAKDVKPNRDRIKRKLNVVICKCNWYSQLTVTTFHKDRVGCGFCANVNVYVKT